MGNAYKGTERVISWLGDEEHWRRFGSHGRSRRVHIISEEVQAVETWLFSNLDSYLLIGSLNSCVVLIGLISGLCKK
jgi:hypothetical protein